MIWLQPWIGFGAALVALPILIHLLGRGRARTERFPSLRFITDTRLQPTRRTRIHDALLLLLRVAIVLAAVAALAQPYFTGGARRQDYAQSLARVILLDTSASMQRASPTAARPLDSARVLAAQLANESTVQLLWPTDDIANAIEGANAWLAQQRQRPELVVVSDFQAGAPYEQTLSRVSATTGIRLVRVQSIATTPAEFVEARASLNGAVLAAARPTGSARDADVDGVEIVSRSVLGGTPGVRSANGEARDADSASTDVEWLLRSSRVTPVDVRSGETVRVHVADSERAPAANALVAANSVSPRMTVAPADSARDAGRLGRAQRQVIVVTHAAAERTALLAESEAIRIPWMVDVVAALQANELLRNAAMTTTATAVTSSNSDSALAVVRGADSRVLVAARQTRDSAAARLLLLANFDVSTPDGSASLAALAAATQRVLAGTEQLHELEPSSVSDASLRRWERAPSDAISDRSDDEARDPLTDPSDGRWFWILVLLLLAAETLIRRRLSTVAAA